jgi:hypothetical protein
MDAPSLPDDKLHRDQPGPYAALAARARRTADGALAIDAAIGCAWLAALIAWHPAWWQFVVAPVAIGAFGLWGIVDRELVTATMPSRRRVLLIGRAVAAAVGTLAVLLSAFRVLGALIGTVIS